MEETVKENPEGMETEQPEESQGKKEEPEKTFTRDELDKMIAAEKRKAAEAAKTEAMAELKRQQEEAQRKQTEAEKFAKMQADEQVKTLQEKLAELEHEKQEIQKQREADQLKQLAMDKAAAAELPLPFINDLDYKSIEAEALDDLIKERLDVFNAEVEKRLNQKLKQSPPETHVPQNTDPLAWKIPDQQPQQHPWNKFTRR